MDIKTRKTLVSVCALVLISALCVGISAFFKEPEQETVYGVQKSETAEDSLNFLVLGTDREAGLCDVMMLVNVNFTSTEVAALQIPRDTYAKYTDRSYKKLNGAYSMLGGAASTAQFIGEAMGISIDHYVCMGLDALCDVVDVIGGVDIEIPFDMRYSDPEQGLYINFRAGQTHLDGALAEKFVRFRSAYAEGDLGRLDAQKLFITALIEKTLSEFSTALAIRICEKVEGIETDMTVQDMVSIATRTVGIDKSRMFLMTLPGEQVTATESGASYYVLSSPAVSEITGRYFGRSFDFDTNKVFLNTRYDSFERIYEEYAQYEVATVGDISQNGVNIQLRR
jgi:LCP family protein required for cell wall assembly